MGYFDDWEGYTSGARHSPEEFQRQWEKNGQKHTNKTGHPIIANTHGWACLDLNCNESNGQPEKGRIV